MSVPLDTASRVPDGFMSKDAILLRIVEILHETFDIDVERISPSAKLYDDLDIDSIDAIDLIVRLKPLVKTRLQPDAFKSVRTVQDVVDALYFVVHDDKQV